MKLRLPRFGCLSITALILALVVIGLAVLMRSPSLPDPQPLPQSGEAELEALRPIGSFAEIEDPQLRSIALFAEAGRVIQHPRCMNCHPRSDRPTQTEEMMAHMPAVTRGPDGGGPEALRCVTCHNETNFEASGVPGNPEWGLAPIEMAWQGRSLGEICRQLLDPARSHMTRQELLDHMAHDELVGWAWHPGGDREPPPGTQEQFGELVEAWLETGGHCPA